MYFAYNKDQLPYKQAEFDYVKGRIQRAVDIYKIAEDVSKAIGQLMPSPSQRPIRWTLMVCSTWTATISMWNFRCLISQAYSRLPNSLTNTVGSIQQSTVIRLRPTSCAKAAEFGVAEDQPPAAVLSEAGYGIPDKHQLMEEILHRARMAKNAENAVLLGNLNFMLADLPIEALVSANA